METKVLNEITIDDFKSLLNNKFDITFSENITLGADLIEVLELRGYSVSDRGPFSLVFRTELKSEYYNQGIYKISHPIKGEIEVFMVPIGVDKKGIKYEVVFS
ncbi:MAG: hypothetical protein V4683_12720 [Bacteroidota bacterium]